MQITNLAGFKNIDKFVEYKLNLLHQTNRTLKEIFPLMFSEKENILGEKTDGYIIKKTTYGQAYEHINLMTGKLTGLLSSIPESSIIGIYLDNSIDWIILFWSILQAGYRPMLMNMRLDDETLSNVIKEYDVKAVISDCKNFDAINLHLADIYAYEKCEDFSKRNFENEIIFMSSNTSSHLKLCCYTGEELYHQLLDSAKIIKNCAQIKKHYNGQLKHLAFLPFYHVFGFIAVYWWFSFFSRTFVFLKDNSPKTLLNTIKKHSVTHIFSVPLFWETVYKGVIQKVNELGEKTYAKLQKGLRISERLAKSSYLGKKFRKVAFRRIRENLFGDSICFMITGGGYIKEEMFKFFNLIGYHLANGYGMTELGITSVDLSTDLSKLLLGSVGKPFNSITYSINEDGELLVEGVSVANKIYCDGKLIAGKNEKINTHDLFHTENSFYYIDGRKDELVIAKNGENLNPILIEPKLLIKDVENICLFGGKKEPVTLLVQVNKYLDLNGLKNINDSIRKKLAELKLDSVIENISFTSSLLIADADFKLNRKKIARNFNDKQYEILSLNPSAKKINEQKNLYTEKVREIFAKCTNKPLENVTNTAHFFTDLGGSSLDYFTMISMLETEFGVTIRTDIASIPTVEEMALYIEKLLRRS